MGIHSKILVHWTGKSFKRREEYVERLRDDIKNGLFAKRTVEESIRKLKVENLIRICFTEIRLSHSRIHADRYGKLGIGFTRDFIMNKGGRPVIYIPFEAETCLMEDSLKGAYERSKGQEEIHRPLTWVLAFIKRMWNEKGEESYEEMEWRLVFDERPRDKYFTKGIDDTFRLKFEASDVKVIIFPDDKTQQMAFEDPSIKDFFSKHTPIMVTLDDCDNF